MADRRGNGGTNDWGIVQDGGSVTSCDQLQARAQWGKPKTPAPVTEPENPLVKIADDELIREIRRRGLTVTQETII